jgi:dihydrodipicolinate synthase/N-acetylneuraminate lyase
MTERKAWHGVFTAAALPFNDDYSVDFDSYAEHVGWMAAAGTHGVSPTARWGSTRRCPTRSVRGS